MALWGWQETAARNLTKILQEPASENNYLLNLLKFTARSRPQLTRAQPHHRSLAATRSNQAACPKSPPPLNQHHGLWPPANPRKPRLVSNHHGHKKPRRPFSPPTKHPALPKPLGQAAQLPQRSRRSRGNDHSRLTAPQAQSRPRSVFKVYCPSTCTAAKLACDGSANRFRSPKTTWPRRFCFIFSPSARFLPHPLAQRWRRRHGGAVPQHCWQVNVAQPAPTARPRRSRVRCTPG